MLLLCPVNEKYVTTDETYYATTDGKIQDVDFHNMALFRKRTLYNLLSKVPSSISRMGRPVNAVAHFNIEAKDRSRSGAGAAGGLGVVRDGSVMDGSEMSEGARQRRRGTINFMKNFMISKIRNAQ